MVQFDVLTIFPTVVEDALRIGLLAKALDADRLVVNVHDLRGFSDDKHRRVDDVPYGGGPGMVLQVEPIVKGLEAVSRARGGVRRILLSPRGSLLNQQKVAHYSTYDQLVLICGRYEGVDERVSHFIDEELSIGDYILAGGEYAALVLIDAVARLLPGVVGARQSLAEESFYEDLLEYPQYSKPREFRELQVPEVLLSGDHGRIRQWRREQAEAVTQKRRPDLLRSSIRPAKAGKH